MHDDLTEDLVTIDGLPDFILADGETVRWWNPVRTGNDNRDHDAGAAYFDATMRAVRLLDGNPQHTLSSIILGMTTIGPVERGFIDRLAAKATYAVAPAPAPDAVVNGAAQQNPELTVESIRAGETYAIEMIEVARYAEAPCLIAEDIIDIRLTGGYGGAGYLWTMCAAAGNGAAN